MKKPRVLLTGGTGLLALNWACAMREQWDVVLGTHQHRVELRGAASVALDLASPSRLQFQLDALQPDLIVHTAGLTDVDRCEDDPALAHEANAEIARNTAMVAATKRIRLVYISTDHLFTGDRSFYREEDRPQPLNEYGRTKLLAEEWVMAACPHAIAVRTNFFGWGYATRQSFSDWLIYNLRKGRPLSLFDDVFFSPILADALAIAAHELVARGASGVFNLVGDERISKHEFGMKLADAFGLSAMLIRRGQVANANLRAPRPRDMSLDNAKARAALGRDLGMVDEFLAMLRTQERAGRPAELLHAVSECPVTRRKSRPIIPNSTRSR